MANPLIPLQSRATQPRMSYPEAQAQALTLQSLQRKGQSEDIALAQQRQAMQDQLKLRQILSSGLPDDQTVAQLKLSGLPDAAFAYQKSVNDRNEAIAKLSKEARDAHAAEIEQDAQTMNGLLQFPQGSQERNDAWQRIVQADPGIAKQFPSVPDDVTAKTVIAQGTKVLDQINVQKAKDEATQKAALAPLQQREATAKAQTAEQVAQGTQPISPYQQAQLNNQAETNKRLSEQATATEAFRQKQLAETERNHRATEAAANLRAQNTGRATGGSMDDIEAVVDGIESGTLPPDLTGMYTRKVPIEAGLAKRGYNLQRAQSDWKGVQRYIATLNGAQQTRLRQAVEFAYETIPQLEDAYNRWKKAAGDSNIRIFNKAALKTTMELGGNTEAGSAARQLSRLINDYASELGTVYKGGNSSTDESLRLAATNLQADWSEKTFNDAVKSIKQSMKIRKNSMDNVSPAGVTPGSPYVPGAAPQASPQNSDPLGIR